MTDEGIMRPLPDQHPRIDLGFSLIELVIVVVIIAIIGAIAVPRLSNASENAAQKSVLRNQSVLQRALDLYEVEHEGTMAHVGASTRLVFYQRLIGKTDIDGTVNASGIYGPYIDGIPTNIYNGLNTIRFDGAAAGANTAGWRYDTTTGKIEPDHAAGTTTFKTDSGTVNQNTDTLIKGLGG